MIRSFCSRFDFSTSGLFLPCVKTANRAKSEEGEPLFPRKWDSEFIDLPIEKALGPLTCLAQALPELGCAITFAVNQPAPAPTDRRRHLLTQLIVAAVGTLLSVVVHYTLPGSPGQSFFQSVSHLQGNGSQFAWMHFVVSYYTQVAVFLVMVLFAVYRRGPRAWIFAFLSGGAVPELFIFHWLK
jgi:hypothetical protein